MKPRLPSTRAAGLCAGLLVALLPPAGNAQTQAEAIAFLQGSFSLDAHGMPMQVAVSCAQITMQYNYRDPSGRPRLIYQFDPRAVTVRPYDARGSTTASVVISCITGACVLSDRDGPGRVERVGSANPYTNQIEPSRVVRAFQFFQNSCGGPYRSSF